MSERWRVQCCDCREGMAAIEADSVDSIVSDPPYGLKFMGKAWDHGVPGVEFWQAALRVAKPGAHLLAFGGTRTFHRLACAIEDAGWELRDCLGWIYGSGFPKSLDVSKAIDRETGAVREVVGSKIGLPGYHLCGHTGGEAFGHGLSSSTYQTRLASSQVTDPATPAARQWQGWGTALKPAWEPIIMARKPLRGTVAANVQAHGTGAINVDGCRIDGEKPATTRGAGGRNGRFRPINAQGRIEDDGRGRWPANILHDGSDEALAIFPHGSGGSAARFFYCAKASKRDRNEGCERNFHPTVKPCDLMRYCCRLVTPPGGLVLDPFMGSGSTGKAAMLEGFRFVGFDIEQAHVDIARLRIAHAEAGAEPDAPEEEPSATPDCGEEFDLFKEIAQ